MQKLFPMIPGSNRKYILGYPIDALTQEETISLIDRVIENKDSIVQTVVNAAKLVKMRKDPSLEESVVTADLINADGQGVVWASRFLNAGVPERVTGIDLMENLVELANKKKYKIFLFGAKEEVVRSVVDFYSTKFSPDIIAGYRNGYYQKEEERSIVQKISESGAHLLFVAMTSPKKEIFLKTYKDDLNVNYTMGVGGSFDVISGKVKRAPLWMQKTGLEWFYRFLQEPGRMWKRYLVTNSLFIYYVLKAKLFPASFSTKKVQEVV